MTREDKSPTQVRIDNMCQDKFTNQLFTAMCNLTTGSPDDLTNLRKVVATVMYPKPGDEVPMLNKKEVSFTVRSLHILDEMISRVDELVRYQEMTEAQAYTIVTNKYCGDMYKAQPKHVPLRPEDPTMEKL